LLLTQNQLNRSPPEMRQDIQKYCENVHFAKMWKTK